MSYLLWLTEGDWRTYCCRSFLAFSLCFEYYLAQLLVPLYQPPYPNISLYFQCSLPTPRAPPWLRCLYPGLTSTASASQHSFGERHYDIRLRMVYAGRVSMPHRKRHKHPEELATRKDTATGPKADIMSKLYLQLWDTVTDEHPEFQTQMERLGYKGTHFVPKEGTHYDCAPSVYEYKTRENADTIGLLLKLARPLECFHKEQEPLEVFPDPALEALRQANVAAVRLTSILNGRLGRGEQTSGYLTQPKDDEKGWDIPIVLDTGASFSLTPVKSDFVTSIRPCDIKSMTGITDSVRVEGIGEVEWPIRDMNGKPGLIRVQAYYIPQATIRLFSPQSYFQKHSSGSCYFDAKVTKLTQNDGSVLTFEYNRESNLPLLWPADTSLQVNERVFVMGPLGQRALEAKLSLLDASNRNLTNEQKELLLWHQRLGHAGQGWLQSLMRPSKPIIGERLDSAIIPIKQPKTASCPKVDPCEACAMSKQSFQTPKRGRRVVISAREMAIKSNDLKPGDCVSIDQFISRTPGRLAQSRGRETKLRYTGGTIMVDHASGYIFLQSQVSLRSGETIQSKHAFERMAKHHGLRIKRYRGDNQPFASQEFVKDIQLCEQEIDYSGVGAHFQNGVAERALQTVCSWARAMMMHQLLHWPQAFDASLWPFALEHAVYLYNHLPKQAHGLSPVELFTRTKDPSNSALRNARVWGASCFVLDPRLQDGGQIPKWSPRSRQGVYLGVSPEHSNTVGRILNPRTSFVSPQFHVVYDEAFMSVLSADGSEDGFAHDLWTQLFLSGHQRLNDYETVELDGKMHTVIPPLYQDYFDGFVGDEDAPSSSEGEVTSNDSISSSLTPPTPPNLLPGTNRYGRRINQNPRYNAARCPRGPALVKSSHTRAVEHHAFVAGGGKRRIRMSEMRDAQLHSIDWALRSSNIRTQHAAKVMRQMEAEIDPNHMTVEEWHPLALAAKLNDADNPTWEEAMNGPLRKGFHEACETELATLAEMDVWEIVDRQRWMNVLPSTWAFKVKKYPSGEVRKLKARFCCRGDRQLKDVDYFETWAPVVNWTTVRLLLILSIQLGLTTKQVDYTAAFVHAPIDLPPNYDAMTPKEQAQQGVFVDMPRGFTEPGKVYKLKKSLYGLQQSPRNFFNFISEQLTNIGFRAATEIDPCLFISDKVICLLYVDDTLFFARDPKDIDVAIARLSKVVKLEEEDSVAGFLGVHLDDKTIPGAVKLTQHGLIDRIIEALGVEDLPPVDTPSTEVLGTDPEGDPPDCTFNYASVIGMLWYLHGHSRPDLGFAVSQAARFSFCPKRSHELALIRIGQYLKATRSEGLIMKPGPIGEFKMDAYCDSDFMGLYGKEDRNDPLNVKSRTGFVICLNDCPIIWSSKLQDSISTSTMMAEYYALSTCMRDVLPLRELVKTVAKGLKLDESCYTSFKTTVHEDNNGCLTLCNLDPGQSTPRSKFYDVKVHWFRSKLVPNQVVVKKIDTKIQLADLFTKPLVKETFCHLRKLMMGW